MARFGALGEGNGWLGPAGMPPDLEARLLTLAQGDPLLALYFFGQLTKGGPRLELWGCAAKSSHIKPGWTWPNQENPHNLCVNVFKFIGERAPIETLANLQDFLAKVGPNSLSFVLPILRGCSRQGVMTILEMSRFNTTGSNSIDTEQFVRAYDSVVALVEMLRPPRAVILTFAADPSSAVKAVLNAKKPLLMVSDTVRNLFLSAIDERRAMTASHSTRVTCTPTCWAH